MMSTSVFITRSASLFKSDTIDLLFILCVELGRLLRKLARHPPTRLSGDHLGPVLAKIAGEGALGFGVLGDDAEGAGAETPSATVSSFPDPCSRRVPGRALISVKVFQLART
jgi:hypothetical protein